MSFGSPVGLVVGGSNVDGVSTDEVRADHQHAMPPFGTASGEFAEGDHTHAGLGSGYEDVWNDDVPPASPHAQDDECTGASVDPKWQQANPNGLTLALTAHPSEGHYRLQKTSTTTAGLGGYVQAIPASEFSIMCQAGWLETLSGYPNHAATNKAAGLFLTDGFDVDSREICAIGVGHPAATNQNAGSSPVVSTFRMNDYSAGSTWTGTALGSAGPMRWIRMRVDGRDVVRESTPDGLFWFVNAIETLTWDPVYWGIFVTTSSGTGDVEMLCGSFRRIRVLSGAGSSAFTTRVPGQYVRLPLTP